MAANRKTRAARVAAGICAVCLRRLRSSGYTTCTRCRREIAERSAAIYQSRTALGICVRCGESADGYLCDAHAEERRIRRAANGTN